MNNSTPHSGSKSKPVSTKAPVAIVLAAGKGTRMKSDLPKVVHEIGGRPMVCAVVDACLAVGCSKVIAIVGYKQELVREALKGYGAKVDFAVQAEQLGTGHAVRSAEGLFKDAIAAGPGTLDAFVLCGDGPLIRAETLAKLLKTHRDSNASATLATAVLDDPTGYGRIVRDGAGRFARIVEQKVCSPEQLAIREVNPSYYCFDAAQLFGALARVTRNAASGEYYLTDAPELLLKEGGRIEILQAVPAEDVLSINTTEELARVDRIYRERLTQGAAAAGKGAR
jgi:bifunctional UDP-N-acetylglucosamine pyrophosphorylase / glucosamine-1-phosphate N-acetyltransferase